MFLEQLCWTLHNLCQNASTGCLTAIHSKTAPRQQLFYFRLHSRCKILIKGTVWRIQFPRFIWRPPGGRLRERVFGDRKLRSHWTFPRKFMGPNTRDDMSGSEQMEVPFRALSSVFICVPNLFSYCSQQVKLNQKARKVSTGFCWTLKPKNLLCGMESLFVMLDTGWRKGWWLPERCWKCSCLCLANYVRKKKFLGLGTDIKNSFSLNLIEGFLFDLAIHFDEHTLL